MTANPAMANDRYRIANSASLPGSVKGVDMNWIARISIETETDIEHIYERAVTIGRLWNLIHTHLFKKINEILVYQEK